MPWAGYKLEQCLSIPKTCPTSYAQCGLRSQHTVLSQCTCPTFWTRQRTGDGNLAGASSICLYSFRSKVGPIVPGQRGVPTANDMYPWILGDYIYIYMHTRHDIVLPGTSAYNDCPAHKVNVYQQGEWNQQGECFIVSINK